MTSTPDPHVSIERQIRERHQYPANKTIIQFFRDHPDVCFDMCMALELKLLDAVFMCRCNAGEVRILKERVAGKDELVDVIGERMKGLKEWLCEKDESIREKDARIRGLKKTIESLKERLNEATVKVE